MPHKRPTCSLPLFIGLFLVKSFHQRQEFRKVASHMAPEHADDLIYRIDEFGRISRVSETWDAFALENDSPNLAREFVLGRSIWLFISDPSTRQIYRDLIRRLPMKPQIEFDFRCDSSRYRRLLHMVMRTVPASEEIEFRTSTVEITERPPVVIYEAIAERSDRMIRSCSWCKRVAIGELWVEAEEAVEQSDMMQWVPPPLLSHTICSDCHQRVIEAGA